MGKSLSRPQRDQLISLLATVPHLFPVKTGVNERSRMVKVLDADVADQLLPNTPILRETKTTPSLKQKYSFIRKGKILKLVRNDDDKFHPAQNRLKRLTSIRETVVAFFLSVFLPAGFPDSVSNDYIAYQAWNCVQDFCNSITRTLATHAILKGAGVGDAEATPLAATITWLLKDATGMVSSIGFAYLKGSNFDNDSKKWRLFADVINDFATFLDLLSAFDSLGFTLVQCLSSIVKAMVGVAGGATRASLVQHQAKANNMADIQAKDCSQETCTNLVAFACGLMIVPFISGDTLLIAVVFTIFTTIHLYANYKGIRSLRIPLLNLSRLEVCVRNFLADETLDVSAINDSESVWFFSPSPYVIKSGVSVATHVRQLEELQVLKEIYANEGYILTVDTEKRTVCISYEESSDHLVTIRACFHGVLLCLSLFTSEDNHHFGQRVSALRHLQGCHLLKESLLLSHDLFSVFEKAMDSRGWDLSRCLIPRGEYKYSFV